MKLGQDIHMLQSIPGYKLILKAVLKSQIELLAQQLSEFGEEECCILTASLKDGSLGYLGSDSGKHFLETRTEFKSQFLVHCLSGEHKTSTSTLSTSSGHPNKVVRNCNPKSTKKSHAGNRHAPYGQGHGRFTTSIAKVKNKSKVVQDCMPESLSETSMGMENSERTVIENMLNQSTYHQTEVDELETNDIAENRSIMDENMMEPSEPGTGTIIVKQEPDDSYLYTDGDHSNSLEPVSSDYNFSGTNDTDNQKSAGNQSAQSKGKQASWVKYKVRSKRACHLCSKLIAVQNMHKHLVIHSGVRNHKCNYCDRAFSQSPDLRRHIRMVHKIMEAKE